MKLPKWEYTIFRVCILYSRKKIFGESWTIAFAKHTHTKLYFFAHSSKLQRSRNQNHTIPPYIGKSLAFLSRWHLLRKFFAIFQVFFPPFAPLADIIFILDLTAAAKSEGASELNFWLRAFSFLTPSGKSTTHHIFLSAMLKPRIPEIMGTYTVHCWSYFWVAQEKVVFVVLRGKDNPTPSFCSKSF